MRKSLLTIVTSAFFLFFTTSAYNPSTADARIGYRAPHIGIADADKAISKGNYVLVSFWSTSNPDSRITNQRYDRACRSGKISHISVNMDRSSGVGDIACRLDGVKALHCDSATRQTVIRDWRLDANGYGSFLVGPDGNIVAVNPSVKSLGSI